MANIKISELTALTPPDAADLVPVTDSSASQTGFYITQRSDKKY
jgi:hypothetical protein